ncbi:site-specific DNA-methyltransferase [Halobacillus sp. KGW1]|uniref:site-specific DNA-methyltransferase n=1 Tax=Halobacillus sp. KGW1 TaxID=1793726 RepID=UPI000786085A|nr:site-specific DNA-methyltransferase [Halobacillus sp. KGW1]
MSNLDSIKYKNKRKNIPTGELRDFMTPYDINSSNIIYSRNIAKDPQLVWKGKDSQDKEDLVVSTYPIYIHEQIHPQAIIEGMRTESVKAEEQMDLFSEFNNIGFEDLVEFYKHDQNWSNRLILGDSLTVMNSLAEKEGLSGQVQTIYLDPPYGIKFDSNWQVDTRNKVVKDGREQDLTRQPEQIRAYRDTWQLGIHSFLPYLRDRLTVARDLLTETGSIFVQISDENEHLVRSLMDEVFGRENFIALIPFRKKTMPFGANFLEQMGDFIIWYSKNKFDSEGKVHAKYNQLYVDQSVEGEFHHCWYELPDGTRHRMTQREIDNHALLPEDARVYRLKSLEPSGKMDSGMFDYEFEGNIYKHPKNGYATNKQGMDRLKAMRRLQVEGNRLTFIMYADENTAKSLTTPWFDTVGADDKVYVVQTNTEVVKRCILMSSDPGDLVLDPTCGSGTTPFVAEKWGRRWIGIDTSRVALTLARTRLMNAKYPYYLLADSNEGIKKEKSISGEAPNSTGVSNDISKGFIYKRSPYTTLSKISNNEGIDEINDKWEKELNDIVANLNSELKFNLKSWQIPKEPEKNWSQKAKQILELYQEKTEEKSRELTALLQETAGVRYRIDKPYENRKKVRVSGPFTVESISPHRIISDFQEGNDSINKSKSKTDSGVQYEQIVLDNLKIAGVQNTKKDERLKFSYLEPYAGTYINAEGEYHEKDSIKRAAICIGPENGTVGTELVKEAAKEAVKGIGFDILIVCGFAFDPYVNDEINNYGKLKVLITRMNPDILMENKLKKTGAGNLFTVFGEPDIDILKNDGNKISVEINGLDIYDPTTGQVKSSSVSDIACWFIDTSYNGESFFVRHAYFLGNDKQLTKLKKALKAEIEPHVLETIHSTKSREFSKPPTGKIAVKVINYYGDEVLRVYEV